MGRTSRETWAKRVERWKDSGLTAAEFAAELGISRNSLAWWKWRLGAEGRKCARVESERQRSKRSTALAAPITLVELPAPALRESLEVVLLTGVRIRVPADFDATALGRLLEVLGARR